MTFSRKGRGEALGARSAVEPGMLADYEQQAAFRTERGELKALERARCDYRTLTAEGDLVHAWGAEVELVEVALRVASFPSSTAVRFGRKAELLDGSIGSATGPFDHVLCTAMVRAAIAAEQTFWAEPRREARKRERHGGSSSSMISTSLPVSCERLAAYALAARESFDLNDLMNQFKRVFADKEALLREGRTVAFEGAKMRVDGLMRRLCAIKVSQGTDVDEKVELLIMARDAYAPCDGLHEVLLCAMIEAALAIVVEGQAPGATRH